MERDEHAAEDLGRAESDIPIRRLGAAERQVPHEETPYLQLHGGEGVEECLSG